VHHRRPMLAAIAAAVLALTSVACTGPDDDSGPATTLPPGAGQEGDDDATESVTGEGAPDDMDGQLPDDDATGRTETTVDARPTPQEDTDRGDGG
jgi:hypothetical protein